MIEPNLAELVERTAIDHPDRIAVVDRLPVTYRDLVDRACVIAGALRKRGLPPESPIGVLMKRDSELVAALLAILRVGHCYVPLDPDDPPARWRTMIEAAGVSCVLGSSHLLDALDAGAVDKIDTRSITGPRDSEPAAPGGPRLAYVMFTSGSTGRPKGVELEHRSVVHVLEATRDLVGFTKDDRYLAVTTLGFDISVPEIFLPLITGGSLLIRDRHLQIDPLALAADIRAHGVSVVSLSPSVWSQLLERPGEFPSVRVAISIGEALKPALAERLASIADDAWNMYGPTEATIWATGWRIIQTSGVSADVTSAAVSAPIGLPLDGIEAGVFDDDGSPVEDGSEGELWLGGQCLARGYRDNHELTQQRFVEYDGRRFYRTGDVVARHADGLLRYYGRNDDQIKLRGVRIEPMEVETAIAGLPDVRAAAATWFESSSGARSIVAAVVAADGHLPTPRSLHDRLADLLPGPMVPSRFVVCDALPLTASGKVDRNAVRRLAAESSAPEAEETPLTDTQRRLILIWQRVLGVDRVAPDDHFFAIGGDSLVAVAVMIEIEEAFGVALSVRALFEAPTLDALATRLDEKSATVDEAPAPDFIFPLVVEPADRTPMFFCGIDLKMARRGYWTVDCPLFSVAQWAQGQGFLRARSVEELAHRQIEGIRSIQPHGPYRLGGFSFGGLVAYEIAQQLTAAGETVEWLFLLDATEPFLTHDGRVAPDDRGTVVDRLARYKQTAGAERLGARAELRRLGKRLAVNVLNLGGRVPTWQWLNYRLMHLHARHPAQISTRLLPDDRWPAFWYASLRLAKSYVVKPYRGGPVALAFVEERTRVDVWLSLLGPDAVARSFVTEQHHNNLFDELARPQWLAFLNETFAGASPSATGS